MDGHVQGTPLLHPLEAAPHPYVRSRLRCCIGLMLVWAGVIVGQLVRVQWLDVRLWKTRAERQYRTVHTVEIGRAAITDRHGRPLAISVQAYSLFVKTAEMKPDAATVLHRLRERVVFSLERALSRARRHSLFGLLRRRIPPEVARDLMQHPLPGVYVVPEEARMYPQGRVVGPILGFTNVDNRGAEGIEYAYDRWLRGRKIRVVLYRDGRQRRFWIRPDVFSDATGRLELTIDLPLQYIAERLLTRWVHMHRARRGLIVAMDPWTGAIRVHAQYPSMDPNVYTRFLDDPWAVHPLAAHWTFPPGSTLKPAVALIGLQVNPRIRTAVYSGHGGEIDVYGVRIRDHRPFGRLTFPEILTASSNVGIIQIGLQIPKEVLYTRLKQLGFGQKTGVDVFSEVTGIFEPPQRWAAVTPAYIAIGQSLTVTPLQVLRFYAMLANGGYAVTPRFAERFVDAHGNVHSFLQPLGKRCIPKRLVREITAILEQAVTHGTGRRAHIPGVRIAGKTGTSEKLSSQGVIGHISSFVGFFPVEHPRVVMLVLLEDPQTGRFGGEVAAPLFRMMARIMMERWGQPPAAVRTELRHSRSAIVHTAYTQPSTDTDVWPDLRGRSVQDVLRWSRAHAVSLTIIGSGTRVAGQLPYPGTDLGVRHGIVWLEPEPRHQRPWMKEVQAHATKTTVFRKTTHGGSG